VAVIPARGGSKGIPRKNLAPLAGRPLIAYTIEAARQARSVDRVLVSTDDREIAEVAQREGAEAPFLRPADLAGDDVPGVDVALHALDWLAEHEGAEPEYVVFLQPTSPLRTAEDIDAAVDRLRGGDADAVVSVTPTAHHPYWAKRVLPDGRLADFLEAGEWQRRPRQELPPACVLNGAIYAARRAFLVANRSYYGERTAAYVMPPERSLDVDTPWDLYLAGLVLADKTRASE
jgi:CMP-N-acetylneuraminic acid synthetase